MLPLFRVAPGKDRRPITLGGENRESRLVRASTHQQAATIGLLIWKDEGRREPRRVYVHEFVEPSSGVGYVYEKNEAPRIYDTSDLASQALAEGEYVS